jgi:hypothetical protein
MPSRQCQRQRGRRQAAMVSLSGGREHKNRSRPATIFCGATSKVLYAPRSRPSMAIGESPCATPLRLARSSYRQARTAYQWHLDAAPDEANWPGPGPVVSIRVAAPPYEMHLACPSPVTSKLAFPETWKIIHTPRRSSRRNLLTQLPNPSRRLNRHSENLRTALDRYPHAKRPAEEPAPRPGRLT